MNSVSDVSLLFYCPQCSYRERFNPGYKIFKCENCGTTMQELSEPRIKQVWKLFNYSQSEFEDFITKRYDGNLSKEDVTFLDSLKEPKKEVEYFIDSVCVGIWSPKISRFFVRGM